MKIFVEFKQSEGHDEDRFVIDMTKIPQNKFQEEFLKTINKAIKSKDKDAVFSEYFTYDFIDGLKSESRNSDDHVIIWY